MVFLALIIAMLPEFIGAASLPPAELPLLPAASVHDDVFAAWQAAGEQVLICSNFTNNCVALRYRGGPVVAIVHPKAKIAIPRSCFTADVAENAVDGIKQIELATESCEVPDVVDKELEALLANVSPLFAYTESVRGKPIFCSVKNDTQYTICIVNASDDPRLDIPLASCASGVRLAIPSSLLQCSLLGGGLVSSALRFRLTVDGGRARFSSGFDCRDIIRGKVTHLSACIMPEGGEPAGKLVWVESK
jgi:hypothetical protein